MASKPKSSLKGGSTNQRLQPMRATQPFQFRQGSPARKSQPSSPTSMISRPGSDLRRGKWQPDHRSSPDRGERRSPSSPSIKVTNRRSPSPRVCRTSSLDSVAGTYLTGQWPRELAQTITPPASGTCTKSTQTPYDWSSDLSSQQSKGSKTMPSRPGGYQDVEVKQMKQQMRRIAKSSRQEKKERQSPVHGNHSALPQSQTSQPISNPIPIFGRVPRRQNSLEVLNKEIENYTGTIKDPNDATIRFPTQGITPPDGHRAPVPRSSTRTMETQTPQGLQDGAVNSGGSHSPSPNLEQQAPNTPNTLKSGEIGISPGLKYASSPRPNNSYMFQREPPEGAESVKPFKEQDVQYTICPSCPDKQKVHFQPSKNGSFSKFQKKFVTVEQNNNTTNTTRIIDDLPLDFGLQERSSGAGADCKEVKTPISPTSVA